MENYSPICNPKKRRLDEVLYAVGVEKMICDLPDNVLQHILSFLPTKDAVRTCVLSKRWEYLWMSIPSLHLFEEPSANRKNFMDFVNRMMVLHELHGFKFHLSCKVLDDASIINSWISAAVRRCKVSDILLHLGSFNEPYVLPRCLFTSETLEQLTIFLSGALLKLPSSICFSSLKVLHLQSVMFSDDYSTSQLFSSCPILEELFLEECDLGRLEVVVIRLPSLSNLEIVERDVDSESEPNNCQFKIFGDKLTHFRYSGQLLNEYCLYNLAVLNEAELYVHGLWYSEDEGFQAFKLLAGLSNANHLALSAKALGAFNAAGELCNDLPRFNNLVHLVFVEPLADLDLRGFWMMLQSFPFLESLTFKGGLSLFYYQIFDPVPPCFLSMLERIKIYDFEAAEDDLPAVRLFLENVPGLHKMYLYLACREGSLMGINACEDLEALPTGLDKCEIGYMY